jgi:uncharacterized protein (DUF1778 family)
MSSIATERIVVQVTPKQKQHLIEQAKISGLNVSEFIRRAAERFRNAPEDQELEELLIQAERAAKESMALIDETLAFVAASEKRLKKLERAR